LLHPNANEPDTRAKGKKRKKKEKAGLEVEKLELS
jgi:hypothetical protein